MHPTQPSSICYDFTLDFSAWYSLTCPDSWLSQTCRSLVLSVYPEAASDPFRRGIIRQRSSVGWEWAVATSYPSRLACDSNQKPSWLYCLLFSLAFWDRVLQPNSAWLGTHYIAQADLQLSAIPKLASSSCHATLLPYPLRAGITNMHLHAWCHLVFSQARVSHTKRCSRIGNRFYVCQTDPLWLMTWSPQICFVCVVCQT